MHATCRECCESIAFYQGFDIEAEKASRLFFTDSTSVYKCRIAVLVKSIPLIICTALSSGLLGYISQICLAYSTTAGTSLTSDMSPDTLTETNALYSVISVLVLYCVAALNSIGELAGLMSRIPLLLGQLHHAECFVRDESQTRPKNVWSPSDKHIELKDVSIATSVDTPPLIVGLNLTIDGHQSDLLIQGPSGAGLWPSTHCVTALRSGCDLGKTMLLRALSGLMPPILSQGTIRRPPMHAEILEQNRDALSHLEAAGQLYQKTFASLVYKLQADDDVQAALAEARAAHDSFQKAQALCREAYSADSCATFCVYSPQLCYFTEGTLREQVSYPESFSSQCDAIILDLLRLVGLDYLTDRGQHNNKEWYTAWDLLHPNADQRSKLQELGQERVWSTTLSGGEQQRLAFARVLYHGPQLIFMDNPTSALDAVATTKCLDAIVERGIGAVRAQSTWAQSRSTHCQVLDLNGKGNWGIGTRSYSDTLDAFVYF